MRKTIPGNSLSVGFLFDDTLDSNDGVAQYVKRLGAWLQQNGHSVTYLVGQSNLRHWQGGEVHSLAKNLKITWGGNHLSMPLWPQLNRITALLARQEFDIVHVQFPYSPLMSQIVINRLNQRTALIGSVHVFPANQLAVTGSKALRFVYGKSLKRFDRLLSVSPAASEFALNAFGLETGISPNVVDVENFRHSGKFSKETGNNIVFLGRLVKRKGCLELLKAFALLKNDFPQARLTIAGDGPQRDKLEKYSESQGLTDAVKFLGYIEESAKPAVLAGADIACFPSLYGESFGIVLIEAMAAGAGVVVGGNNPGYASVLGSKAELLVEPKDTSKFARQLSKLLTDRRLTNQLHAWQQSEVAKYDIKTVGPQLLSIYWQTIAKSDSSSHNLNHAA